MSASAQSAVILQYHHVSNDTPASTSISPTQFKAHMQYLADHEFNVVPLSEIVNHVKEGKPLTDKTVAITFDDGYIDNLTYAKPILDEFGYNFTIFVNGNIIERGSSKFISWQQLKMLADQGVIIANHGLEHDSLIRKPKELSEQQWQQQQSKNLIASEDLIEQHTGQRWQYFAYPYGEFSDNHRQWLEQLGYVAFSQQSGAVGLTTDLTLVPRFPASKPYDNLASLKDKLHSLPLTLHLDEQNSRTLYNVNELTEFTFTIDEPDANTAMLSCYITGLGKQEIISLAEQRFTISFKSALPIGRVRSNCTAPSKSRPGRFFWYSKAWFIKPSDDKWYPL